MGQDRRRGYAHIVGYYAPTAGIGAEEGLGHRAGLACYRVLRRIPIPRTWLNRAWALLRASPLHGVNHFLRLGRVLVKLGGSPSEAYGHCLTLHILEDYEPELISLPEPNL